MKEFTTPEMEIDVFESKDVITTSIDLNDEEDAGGWN